MVDVPVGDVGEIVELVGLLSDAGCTGAADGFVGFDKVEVLGCTCEGAEGLADVDCGVGESGTVEVAPTGVLAACMLPVIPAGERLNWLVPERPATVAPTDTSAVTPLPASAETRLGIRGIAVCSCAVYGPERKAATSACSKAFCAPGFGSALDSASIADSALTAIAFTDGNTARCPAMTSDAVAMLVARAARPFIVESAAEKTAPLLLDTKPDEMEVRLLANVVIVSAKLFQ